MPSRNHKEYEVKVTLRDPLQKFYAPSVGKGRRARQLAKHLAERFIGMNDVVRAEVFSIGRRHKRRPGGIVYRR